MTVATTIEEDETVKLASSEKFVRIRKYLLILLVIQVVG